MVGSIQQSAKPPDTDDINGAQDLRAWMGNDGPHVGFIQKQSHLAKWDFA